MKHDCLRDHIFSLWYRVGEKTTQTIELVSELSRIVWISSGASVYTDLAFIGTSQYIPYLDLCRNVTVQYQLKHSFLFFKSCSSHKT